MSDAERLARQIAEANTKTAKRLADESRRRWSGVQAGDGPFGQVWVDKSGRVIRGAAGGAAHGASGHRTGSYVVSQGPTVTIGYNNITFDPEACVTNEDTAWTYHVPTGGDGFYSASFALNLKCADGGGDWAWVNDTLEYWLFVGSYSLAMRFMPETAMGSGAEFSIGYTMDFVPLIAGETVSSAIRFTSGNAGITVMRGHIGVHQTSGFFGSYP